MKKQLLISAAIALTAALLPSSASSASTAFGADKPKPARTTVGIRAASHGAADNRGKYEYEILPGKARQDAIAVYNYSLKPVTVLLLARDAQTTPAGEFTAQPSKDKPRDVGGWITISKPVLHLKPRQMTVVPFQIGVPYDATPGDHVGSVLVSLLAKEPKPGGNDLIVEHRVGLRVYLRVPGTLKPQLTIEDLKSSYSGRWKSLGFGHAAVAYTVRNTGNVRLSAKQQVEMLRSFGLSPASARPTEIKELLPGGFVRVQQSFPGTWAVGNVTAKVTLSPAGLDKSVSNVPDVVKEISVFVFPWLLVLILVLIVAAIGGGISWRRRRRLARKLTPDPVIEELVPALPGEGKHRLPRIALAVALLGLVGFGPGFVAPAQAADNGHPIWKATVLPKSGGADDPIELQTSGGCPKPADSILGRVYGKGFPKGGENVIGNTKAGVTPVGPFPAPLAFSMKEFMSGEAHPIALTGTYRFVVTCRTAKYPKSYGDYVAEIRFANPNHWVAAKPVTQAIGQNLKVDQFGDPIETPKPGKGSTPGATQSPGASQSPDAQAGSESGAPALTSADSEGTSAVSYVLIIGGVAIAAATGFLLWRRRA